MTRRAAVIVLDGVGAGAAPDAAEYGDVGSDTLGHVLAETPKVELDVLLEYGLGKIKPDKDLSDVICSGSAYGVMRPASPGKDSTTGHWELFGIHLEKPFPTYSHGFPRAILDDLTRRTGRPVIGNVVASGTDVLFRFGDEHVRTGAWIVYTSADSVFQIAAHEAVVPVDELYRACAIARQLLVPPHDVSRVIARPFMGDLGSGIYLRTANRRDFSLQPPAETLLDALAAAGIPRSGVGKVDDLFAGRNITATHTTSNADGLRRIAEWIEDGPDGLLLANLVDFDQLYGHRNDVAGFYGALLELDRALPALVAALRPDDLLFITADHGNDPTTSSTDHARENVPVFVLGGAPVRPGSIGVRETFADLGATVAEWLGVPFRGAGTSFLGMIAG